MPNPRIFPVLTVAFCIPFGASPAATWSWSWPATPAEKNVTAEIAPLKYGKKWGYTIEIDDEPRDTGVFAPDFFAKYQFTDAPPGVKGGKLLPVVGSMAVYLYKMGANNTVLSYDDLREIQRKGWGVSNHSYMHKGRTYGDPPEELTPEQMQHDLFWSQAILAEEVGQGRAPTHFVYPNGYKAYSTYLSDVGIISASSVGGTGGINLAAEKTDILSLKRNYLDEGAWTGPHAKSDVLTGIAEGGPAEGDLVIDFTHGMNTDPASENQKRWAERLTTLNQRYGALGTDEFWSAPTEEIVNYTRAAKVASTKVTPGKLEVSLPDTLPGSALTVRLEGIPESTKIPTPEGGAVHREGTTVWLTTPPIGLPGVAPRGPRVKKVYQGPAEALIPLEKPVRVAAVQVHQHGAPFPLAVKITQPDGTSKELGSIEAGPHFTSGTHLIATPSLADAPLAQSVEIGMDKGFKEVTVWALNE